jgi:hypothetical protein
VKSDIAHTCKNILKIIQRLAEMNLQDCQIQKNCAEGNFWVWGVLKLTAAGSMQQQLWTKAERDGNTGRMHPLKKVAQKNVTRRTANNC